MVTTKKLVAKLSTLPSAFVLCDAGTVCFKNDHFATVTGYVDYVHGNLKICHVYYVKGLGHNLFSVRQHCDGDLEVAFRSNTCYAQNLEGDDLHTDSRDSNLYTISISKMVVSSLVCLMSRATSTKSWLWHRRVSHLNFGTINQLTSKDLVDRLPKLIMEYLVKISKKVRILELKRRYFKYYCSDNQYAVSIKEDTTCLRLHSPNTMKETRSNTLSLCNPTNDRDDLGKIKPKADIAKASENNNSEPRTNCMNFQDSSEDSQSVPSKTDLDNLFRPLYEEYYATKSPEVSDSSVANTLDNENTSSSSSIVVEEDEAPQIVSSSIEQVVIELNSHVLNENSNELVQEDGVEFDGNVFYNPPQTSTFKEAESSLTFQDPSNMHKFHQKHRSNPDISNHVYRLKKALYGLKQAPRAWFDKLSSILIEKHFTKVFSTRFSKLMKDNFEMSMIGEMKFFLGLQDSGFELIAYSDTDHARCIDDCKSTSEGIQFLRVKLVSWSSKKQDYTAMSTAEAEYVSLSACCAQVIWMRTQLLDYGFSYNKIPVYCDSKSAIAISCNPVQYSRTKHINIRYHFIKEHVEQVFHMAQQVILAAQLVPRFHTIGRCDNYTLLQSIPCSPKCKIVRKILLDHPLSYALIATVYVPTVIKEDYHSIKDDILLVSVYTTGNVVVRGMMILDAFLTEEICATDDFKEYETVFMNVDVPINQPKSHKITMKKKKQSTTLIPPPGDDRERERDEVAEAIILSLRLHKTALAVKAQENIAKVQEKLDEEEIEKMVEGDEDENHMQVSLLIQYLMMMLMISKDEEIEKENKDDNVEKTDEVVKEKDIVNNMIAKEFATHGPKMIKELFRKHMQNTTLNLYPIKSTSAARKSSADLQHQMYLNMKSKPQDQVVDPEI
uniref:Retrovirus-related Pol polyprotein from transposon TNT 1-94 n=1 Tax=Tanacetum cinerariifolium TaxID=118510 RepID=A0A6L2J7T2_TANCI|nr:retrovirus-related Pol polyprotein from transposon TNT 1-94 [Tanacetum cinerariifolium]